VNNCGVVAGGCRRQIAWRRFVAWQREQRRWNWSKVKRWLRRSDGSWKTIATDEAVLFDPTKVRIERYWYRGTKIPRVPTTRSSLPDMTGIIVVESPLR
jgi:RNA-directed DNA polymerase